MPDLALIEQLDQAIDALLTGGIGAEIADPAFESLREIAATLRDLPDDGFKTRLGAELSAETERIVLMSASTTIATAAIHSIVPFICVPEGDKLVDFLKHTFDAVESGRHAHGPGHGFVASVRIADSDLLIMGDESFRGRERPAALHVYVRDCDATYRRALDAGAVTVDPGGIGDPANRPWGERAAFVTDPAGNLWNIATRSGPSYVGIGLKHVTPGLLPRKAPPVIDFLRRAFGAEVDDHYEEDGRLEHTFVHIGEAVLEMSEAYEEGRSFGFYVYTDDVDAVYHRALAAGATSLAPPADQPFGDRMAVLQDPFGNQWIPAKRIK